MIKSTESRPAEESRPADVPSPDDIASTGTGRWHQVPSSQGDKAGTGMNLATRLSKSDFDAATSLLAWQVLGRNNDTSPAANAPGNYGPW